MIQSTTPSIEGKRITRYHGVVTGEAILGANIFKDFLPEFATLSADVPQPMKRNCAKPVKSPLPKWKPKRKVWAQTRSSVSTLTTKTSRWVTAVAC